MPGGSGIASAMPVNVAPFKLEPASTDPDPTGDGGTAETNGITVQTVESPAPPTPEQVESGTPASTAPDGGEAEQSVTANVVEVAPGVVISSSGGAQTSSRTDAEPVTTSVAPTQAAVPDESAAGGHSPHVAPVAPVAPAHLAPGADRRGSEWIPGQDVLPTPTGPQYTSGDFTRIAMTAAPPTKPVIGDTGGASGLSDEPRWARAGLPEVAAVDVPPPPSPELTRVGLIVGVLGLFGFTPGAPLVPGGATPVLQLVWAAWRRESARPEITASTSQPAQPLTDRNCEPLTCTASGAVHGVVTSLGGASVGGMWTYAPTAKALHDAAATDATAATTNDTFSVSIVDGTGTATEVPVNVSLLTPISAENAEVQRIAVGCGPNDVTVGRDGRYAYVAHVLESTLGVLDSWTGSVTYLDTTAPVGRAQLTADGSRLYAANANNGTMTVVDTTTNTVIDAVPVGGYASDFVLDTNGNRAYVLVNPPNEGFDLVVIDTATTTVIDRTHLGPDADLPALSPDGGTLFVRDSLGRTIRAIDTATLSATDIPADHDVTVLAVSPDGRHLFVSTFPDLLVYDTRTHVPVRSFDDLGGARFLVFSPDGSMLYTANFDGDTLAVIDTTTLAHTTVHVSPHPTNAVVSPDGQQLFLLNGDGTVSVLDAVTKTVETIDIHGKPNDLYQIAMSPDGRHVYVPQYETGTLAVISARTVNLAPTVDVDQAEDPGTGAVTYTATGDDADGDHLVYTAALLAPGTLTTLGRGRFRFEPHRALSGHLTPGVHDAVSITVSDGHGGSTSVRGTYAVAPSTEATVLATVTVGGEVRSVALSPDGATAYVPIIDRDGRSRVEVIDTTTGDLHAVVALADDPRGTASLNSDGSRLVVPGGEYVTVIDTTTFEVIAALEGADHAVLSADGLKAYTLRAHEMSVYDVDPGSQGFGTRIATFRTGGYAEGMTSGPDGRIYFATSDFTVTAIDTATDRVVATIETTSGSHNLTTAPGRLYAPLHSTSLSVIDTDAGTVRANVPIRVQSPGPYVTANADGSRVYLSRREEGILSVFDPTTDTIVASVRVGDGTVHPAAVSADGSLVVVPVGDSITMVSTGRTIGA